MSAERSLEVAADALMLPLMFHSGGSWTETQAAEWKRITGTDQVTSKVMCDHIRLILEGIEKP